MPAKKKTLSNKKIADGELAPDSFDVNSAMTIDELMGSKEDMFSPWKAKTSEDLEKRIESMNLADLQNLATRVGIIPVHDRRLLKQRLTKQFEAELKVKNRHAVSAKPSSLNRKVSKKTQEQIMSILREGR